ncbi:MAG: SMR family transporter [Symbiopectobacterium sp.]
MLGRDSVRWRLFMTYLFLSLAIVAKMIATSALKLSDGFSCLMPNIITVIFYGVLFSIAFL